MNRAALALHMATLEMTAHRRPEIQFSDAPRGVCRWCGEDILYKSGEKRGNPNRRRRWHPECVDIYNASDPREARRRIRKRDRGRCAECRVDTYKIRRELQKLGKGRARAIRERGYKPGKSFWELDHIVPLIDGGTHDDDNLQTLCTPCHTAKTAEEARTRAERNRDVDTDPPQDGPDEPDLHELESRIEIVAPGSPANATKSEPPGRPRRKVPQSRSVDELLEDADAVNARVSQALKNTPSPRRT